MLNEIVGMYLADQYGITTDRILFALSVDPSGTPNFTIKDATDGVKLKNDLATLQYFITKYSIWTQNGILDVTILPDNEVINQIKTWAFTKITESPIVPVKPVLTDLNINVINNQTISDDLFIVFDIMKVPQKNVVNLIEIGKAICTAPDDVDLQTLGIEKYLVYTNQLLQALILAGSGTVPASPSDLPTPVPFPPPPSTRCRRT